jgi:hypothetical protein
MSYLKYRGRVIRGCADAAGDHSGRWIIQTYHEPTGNPWSDGLCPHYPSLRAAKESILADMEEGAANARLIAAAPDLLAALEAYDQFARANDDWDDGEGMFDFILKARAAIAKATGEVEETPTA